MKRALLTLLLTLATLSAVAQPTVPADPADSLLTIAMCGDIMMGTDYPTVRLPQNGGADIFTHVKPLFLAADL